MADIKALTGSAWGVPVKGALVSLGSADVTSILGAAAGLARGLFFAGGVVLAVGAVALFASLQTKRQRIGWSTLARAGTFDRGDGLFASKRYKRQFTGVCLTREISIRSDSHTLSVPIDYIENYHSFPGKKGFFSKEKPPYVGVRLFDGSEYSGELLLPKQYQFLTPLGSQVLETNQQHEVIGQTVSEAEKLRQSIELFLESEARSAEKLLGSSEFERFFAKA